MPQKPARKKPVDRRSSSRRSVDVRLAQKERQLEAARRISEALFQQLSTEELLAKALQTALEVVGAESGSLLLVNDDRTQLIFRHSIGEVPVKIGTAIPCDQGIAGAVFQSGKPIVVGDAARDPRHLSAIDELTKNVTHDMIAIPLTRWEGEPIGVLEIVNKRQGRLDEDDVAILSIVSALAATSIEQARFYHEAKLAEVVRLLGDISHDIKNLLMPVVCGAGLLDAELKDIFRTLPDRDGSKAQASYQLCAEVIEMLGNATRRIQDRVKEIADCVKGLSSEPEFAPCQLEKITDTVVQTLRWLADQRGVRLEVEGMERLPVIVADERRLFNAFYNLVNNAIPEVSSGGSITIVGKEEPPGVGVVVSVRDTGKGMLPEVRDRLFTARAKSTKAGGTGLGTKIVKDVVDAHKGRVVVESEVGVGTTFHVYLPLSPLSVEKKRLR